MLGRSELGSSLTIHALFVPCAFCSSVVSPQINWPTKWIIVTDEQLPKTKTKKYIRVNLSTHLGLDPKEDENDVSKSSTKTKVDWEVIGAFRFVLACYVMFMHIGSNESWGAFNNLRGCFTSRNYNPILARGCFRVLTRRSFLFPSTVAVRPKPAGRITG